jgi:hypothetical protein
MSYRDHLETIAFFQGIDAPALAVIAQAAREQCVARDKSFEARNVPSWLNSTVRVRSCTSSGCPPAQL